MPPGPFAYPFYCRNGMEIKKWLALKKIYVPTLWPGVLKCSATLARDYAENILPLPVDQRYGAAEMENLADAVLEMID